MIRHQIARILCAIADRIEPSRPVVTVGTSTPELQKALADVISGHIVGRGVAGRKFHPGTGTDYAY